MRISLPSNPFVNPLPLSASPENEGRWGGDNRGTIFLKITGDPL